MPKKSGTEAALLAAILASPDDDLPRMVFADWCEENGDPTAPSSFALKLNRHKHAIYDDGAIDILVMRKFASLQKIGFVNIRLTYAGKAMVKERFGEHGCSV